MMRRSAVPLALIAVACGTSHKSNHGSGASVEDGSADASDDASANGGGDDSGMAAQDAGQDEAEAAVEACGITVGKRLCDVSVEGYFRDATSGLASSAPYGSFHLSELLAKGTETYAMVFLGAFW
jgi:hypothetical protein